MSFGTRYAQISNPVRKRWGAFRLRDFAENGAKRPVCLVYGNCQAESLRLTLESSETFRAEYATYALPPVHEIDERTIPLIREAIKRSDLLITHPVVDNFHNLPLGAEQMRAVAGGDSLKVTALYYQGLFPFQTYVRSGAHSAVSTGYDDLRYLYCAALGKTDQEAARWIASFEPRPDTLRQVHQDSVAELHRREADLATSLASHLGGYSFHTVNHPTPRLLQEEANQILEALGMPRDASPAADLLSRVRTPLEAPVIKALGLTPPPREHWSVGRSTIPHTEMLSRHLQQYRANPQVVRDGILAHEEKMEALGLDLDEI